MAQLNVATLPKLTPAQYRQVEAFLAEWKAEVLTAAKRHPGKSYQLGYEQTTAFLKLTGRLQTVTGPAAMFGGHGPSAKAAVEWANKYTLRELDDSLNTYIGHIKDALLYGLRATVNPTELASWLYKATQDAEVNWRTIARTEMVRANAAGRLAACRDQGYDKVWAPPHVGACSQCKRLLENQVFDLAEVEHATNFGRPMGEWIACIPLHPHCRHCWLPYVPEVYEEMQRLSGLLDEHGLTDERLDEMFDDSGHLQPEYQDAVPWEAFKTTGDDGPMDRYGALLEQAIAKAYAAPAQDPMAGLPSGLWEGGQLRPQIPAFLRHWLNPILGHKHQAHTRLFLTGPATDPFTPQTARPHLHVGLVVDYPALRAAHPEYAVLSDPELHAALTTSLRAQLADREPIPGTQLTASLAPETTLEDYVDRAQTLGRPVYDVSSDRWLIRPTAPRPAAFADTPAGIDAVTAVAHPDWLQDAEKITGLLTDLAVEDRLDDLAVAYKTLLAARGSERGRLVWDYAWEHGPLPLAQVLVEKTSLDTILPGHTITGWAVGKVEGEQAGEHWITVHPHGDDEKGIPVLVRENKDGTATIIGGAGGHLTGIRIQHKARVSGEGKKKGASGSDQALEHAPMSPEEAEAQRQAQESAAEAAHEVRQKAKVNKEHLDAQIVQTMARIWAERGVAADGTQTPWEQLDEKDRARLLKQARATAHEQGSWGDMNDRSNAQAGPIKLGPGLDAPKGDGDGDAAATAEGEEHPESAPQDQDDTGRVARTSQPLLALSTEESEHLLGLYEAKAGADRALRDANRVIRGQRKPADTSLLEWDPETDIPAAAKRRAERLAETRVARELLETMERPNIAKEAENARQRGGRDSLDALGYSVFGYNLLPERITKLLGVGGSAQLMIHTLQQEARAGKLDLKAVKDTIDSITDDRQKTMLDLDLKRGQAAIKAVMDLADPTTGEVWTDSQKISRRGKKLREAATSVGYAIASCEALHEVRANLTKPIDRIEVHGFPSRTAVREAARKAGVKLNDSDIVRQGAGDYTLRIEPDRFDALMAKRAPGGETDQTKEFLSKIRSGQGLEAEVTRAQTAPGYTRTLDPIQARGSLYLRHSKKALLAFAPGVGKTDTTLAAFMQLRHDEPEKDHRILIVAPKTATENDGPWAKTTRVALPGMTYEVVGSPEWKKAEKRRAAAVAAGQEPEPRAPIQVASMDWLKGNAHVAKTLGHTIAAVDESQYAKGQNSQRLAGLHEAGEGLDYRWALSGTPLEKNMGELHSQIDWCRPGEYGDQAAFKARYEHVNQFDTLTSEEAAQHFRESLSAGMYFAAQKGQSMPELSELNVVHAPLTEGHQAAYSKAADAANAQRREVLDKRAELREHYRAQGLTQSQAANAAVRDTTGQLPAMGGYGQLKEALFKPHRHGYTGPNSREEAVSKLVREQAPTEFKGMQGHPDYADGAHAGTYAPKSIVFGREVQILDGVAKHLKDNTGHKVFYTHGQTADNDGVLAAFLAHKGPAVLVTSDKNKTARSLQFGDNDGFQHGATQVIHTDMPQNTADMEQRNARAWRRGAQVPVKQHIISSNTPIEQLAFEQMQQELATRAAVGNPEDAVDSRRGKGRQTIDQKLAARGQQRIKREQPRGKNPKPKPDAPAGDPLEPELTEEDQS